MAIIPTSSIRLVYHFRLLLFCEILLHRLQVNDSRRKFIEETHKLMAKKFRCAFIFVYPREASHSLHTVYSAQREESSERFLFARGTCTMYVDADAIHDYLLRITSITYYIQQQI